MWLGWLRRRVLGMGHQLIIESAETLALATRLAELTGESTESAIAGALRMRMDAEQKRKAAMEKARKAVLAFHDLLEHPRPASDHGWLYDDETGLPV